MDLRSYGEKEVLEKKGCLLFVQSDGDGDEDDDSCAFKGVVLKAASPDGNQVRTKEDMA